MPKTIAFYLPQFHTIPENDEWWGEGFTEWTNVKKSQPQYEGHIQPEMPIDKNYYNLLDENVQIEQANLAKKYGVYGFCYYHYWFEGKLLLEKPLDNMLKNKDIDMPFCMCWANESWSRNWDGQEHQVLIAQNYSEGKSGWENHFRYLLDFFKDDRYIRIDGKPVFVVYKPQLIRNCKEMVDYWQQLAKNNGFSEGLYWVYQHDTAFDFSMENVGFDCGIEFEPFYTVRERKRQNNQILYALKNIVRKIKIGTYIKSILQNKKSISGLTVYSYDDIWNQILKRKPEKKNVIPGAFVSWDNTPRRGNCATVFKGATPSKFKTYFENQLIRARDIYSSDFIFINAWNEWAEGAHLEPDEHNGLGYLDAVRESLKVVSD